jgi:hypothetical protein
MLFWFEGVKIVQYYDNTIMILYDFTGKGLGFGFEMQEVY